MVLIVYASTVHIEIVNLRTFSTCTRVTYNYGPTSDYTGPIKAFPPLPIHMDRVYQALSHAHRTISTYCARYAPKSSLSYIGTRARKPANRSTIPASTRTNEFHAVYHASTFTDN